MNKKELVQKALKQFEEVKDLTTLEEIGNTIELSDECMEDDNYVMGDYKNLYVRYSLVKDDNGENDKYEISEYINIYKDFEEEDASELIFIGTREDIMMEVGL